MEKLNQAFADLDDDEEDDGDKGGGVLARK